MKLDRNTKRLVKPGDVIRFKYGDAYTVLTVITGRNNSVSYTLQDIRTKQVIYCYPSSDCYGADIVSNNAE